jgi:hypothetical protein
MSIFDTMGKFIDMANDPNLAASAEHIGKLALDLPGLLNRIAVGIEAGAAAQVETNILLGRIEQSLDASLDPIPRPPFQPADVEKVLLLANRQDGEITNG